MTSVLNVFTPSTLVGKKAQTRQNGENRPIFCRHLFENPVRYIKVLIFPALFSCAVYNVW